MRYNLTVRLGHHFIDVEYDKITIGIKSRPQGGIANREIVNKLARYFNVTSSQIRILSGLTSRKKVVEILK